MVQGPMWGRGGMVEGVGSHMDAGAILEMLMLNWDDNLLGCSLGCTW